MRNIVIALLVCAFIYTSCTKEPATEKSSSGYFILSQLKRSDLLKSGSTALEDSSKNYFNLGDIKSSQEFLFILSNGGDNAITDIEISSNNSAFQIQPNKINSLAGKDSVGSSLIPLLSLRVIHGVQLNGVGYTELLPMNENTAEITITGKTIKNGKALILNSTFGFSVNAKTMDMNLYDGTSEINLLNPTGSAGGGQNYGGLGMLRLYTCSSSNLKIENTGNVNITVNPYVIDMYGSAMADTSNSLAPYEKRAFYLKNQITVFELNGNGTITNDSRIQLGNNGMGYFMIQGPR